MGGKLLKSKEIASLNTEQRYINNIQRTVKSFEYMSYEILDNDEDILNYRYLYVYDRWYIDGKWNSWGNGCIIPVFLIKEQEEVTASTGSIEMPNTTSLYIAITKEYSKNMPYIYSMFNASEKTPTKAKVFIYGIK